MDTQTMLRRLSRTSPVGRSFGPVYEKGDILVIPVAIVAGGGGVGQMESSDEAKANAPPAGFGGGSGGFSLPLGVYEVKGDRVRFVPAFDLTRMVVAALGLLKFIAGRRRRAARHGSPG